MNRSRKAYIDALATLLEQKDFSKITTSDVIALSGYGRTGFYRQFSDKYALARAFVRERARSYATILARDLGNASCDMLTMVTHILEHVLENRAAYHAILTSQIPNCGFDEFCEYALADFRIMANASPNCSESMLDYDLFYHATTWQFADYLRYWEMRGCEPPVAQMAQRIVGVIEHLAPGVALSFK